MRYRLIAIDLDGTLLDQRGGVSPENLSALAAAESAGARIVPCTGRLWRESRMILDRLPSRGPGVFVSGAAISDTASGASLDVAVIEPRLAHELVEFLEDLPEAVLVCRDAELCGHDYLVTGSGALTSSTQWWFEATGATVHFQRRVTAEDLHHTLRVGVVTTADRFATLSRRLATVFQDRVMVHGFEAVQTPDPHEGVFVLEVFGAGVNKWRGLTQIAQEHEIEAGQIAAIGDQVNDVSMIRSAGCGIAMGNAIDEVKSAADHITLGHQQHGVAHAIDQLLAGVWGAA